MGLQLKRGTLVHTADGIGSRRRSCSLFMLSNAAHQSRLALSSAQLGYSFTHGKFLSIIPVIAFPITTSQKRHHVNGNVSICSISKVAFFTQTRTHGRPSHNGDLHPSSLHSMLPKEVRLSSCSGNMTISALRFSLVMSSVITSG